MTHGLGGSMFNVKFFLKFTFNKEIYVVKHKSAKLFMMYAVGKLEEALNISHLISSTSIQRFS